MKNIIVALLLAAPAYAQVPVAPTPISLGMVSGTAVDVTQESVPVDQMAALYAWVKTQQANAGISYDLHHVKYACTWWDLVSLGSSGIV